MCRGLLLLGHNLPTALQPASQACVTPVWQRQPAVCFDGSEENLRAMGARARQSAERCLAASKCRPLGRACGQRRALGSTGVSVGVGSCLPHAESVRVPSQHSFFCRLTEDKKSEKFFKVFYDRMKVAQQEIKATVTVNTSDLGNKKKDDEADRDAPSRKKGKHPTCCPPGGWSARPQGRPLASFCPSVLRWLPDSKPCTHLAFRSRR